MPGLTKLVLFYKFYFIICGKLSYFDAIHNFSLWLTNGSDPVDILVKKKLFDFSASQKSITRKNKFDLMKIGFDLSIN